MEYIDLRSDTVTQPTPAMRKAMAEAVMGDDVYEDDPTVKELENKSAAILKKEAALFVPTGTFGNQLALLTHCSRGTEVILNENCHIVQHECGAAALISGVQLRCFEPANPYPVSKEYEKRIRIPGDIHEPVTSLLVTENPLSNGTVLPLSELTALKNLGERFNLPIHMDGARIFNAALSLNVSPAEIARCADSVMFCFSKGLCAPVGSMLAGTKEFIKKARRNRKLMGGGLHKAGAVAAAALVALQEMPPLLRDDHEKALLLGQLLSEIPELSVDITRIQINMVFFNFRNNNIDREALATYLRENGILINPPDKDGIIRLVTHHWITSDNLKTTVSAIKDFLL